MIRSIHCVTLLRTRNCCRVVKINDYGYGTLIRTEKRYETVSGIGMGMGPFVGMGMGP